MYLMAFFSMTVRLSDVTCTFLLASPAWLWSIFLSNLSRSNCSARCASRGLQSEMFCTNPFQACFISRLHRSWWKLVHMWVWVVNGNFSFFPAMIQALILSTSRMATSVTSPPYILQTLSSISFTFFPFGERVITSSDDRALTHVKKSVYPSPPRSSLLLAILALPRN